MQEGRQDWYLTLISLLFGVFISLWMDGLAKHGEMPDHPGGLALGLLVLLVLVCLWWWYGVFLGRVSPANNILLYVWDFATLATFAYGARSWAQPEQFMVALVIAVFMMAFRVALAWRESTPRSEDRYAVRGVTAVLVASAILIGTFWLGATAGSDEVASGKEAFVPAKNMWMLTSTLFIVLGLGCCVTFYAAWATEGVSRIRVGGLRPQMRPKLQVILANPPANVSSQDIQVLRQCAVSGLPMFESLLREKLGARVKSHLSSVHAIEDVDTHAVLASLPSVRRTEVMKAKSFWTYFCHWVDDLCDAKPATLPMRHIKHYIENGTWPKQDIRLGCLWTSICGTNRIVSFIEHVCQPDFNPGVHNPHQVTGMKRILLGSLLFSAKNREYAKRQHNLILKQWLSPNLSNQLGDFGVLVDLTTKTALELWAGFERNAKPDTMFLYNLLYAPAIYYHNCNEEVDQGEIDGLQTVTASEMAATVRRVATSLREASKSESQPEENEALKLRVWQIRSMVYSCANILPPELQTTYWEVADELEKAAVALAPLTTPSNA